MPILGLHIHATALGGSLLSGIGNAANQPTNNKNDKVRKNEFSFVEPINIV